MRDRGRRMVSVLTPSNDARLVAGGDVVFEQLVDTSDRMLATFTPPGGRGEPDVEQRVPGGLTIEAQGTTTFQAHVGSQQPLARLDVTDVRLPAGDTPFTLFTLASVPVTETGPRIVIEEDAFAVRGAFGRIDGANQLRVIAKGSGDDLSRVTFRGDIGASQPLPGLDVHADRIEFTTAERVLTGSGGIALNFDPADDAETAGAPAVATIYDTQGSIAFETSGNFEIGRLQKFTGLGALSIQAEGTASFGDLAALAIAVDAPTILWKWREPSELLLAAGGSVRDAGSDLVANDIAFSSVPVWDGWDVDPSLLEGAKPVLVVGSGGVSAPGSLADFEVIRLNEAIDAVTPAILTGPGRRAKCRAPPRRSPPPWDRASTPPRPQRARRSARSRCWRSCAVPPARPAGSATRSRPASLRRRAALSPRSARRTSRCATARSSQARTAGPACAPRSHSPCATTASARAPQR